MPHGVQPTAIRVERSTRHKRHLLIERHLEHIRGVHLGGKNAPQEHAPFRMGPARLLGPNLLHRIHHHVAAFLVDLADIFHMLIQETALAHFVGDNLVKGGGMQVSSLFRHDQLADDLCRGDHPRQADTRREQLGECAQIDDISGERCFVTAVLGVQ